MSSAFVSFLHFVAVLGLASALVVEWVLFSATPTHREARLIQAADRWYGLFSVVLLTVGFARVFWFEKGSAYYFANPFFHAKLGLFVIIGLLSIYPTLRFIKWRSQMTDGQAPVVLKHEFRTLRALLRTELALLAMVLVCATLMARGVSF